MQTNNNSDASNPYSPPPLPGQGAQPPRGQAQPTQGQFGQNQFGQNQFGQNQFGQGQAVLPARGGLILGLGIGSLVLSLFSCIGFILVGVFGGVLAIVTIVLANGDLSKMRAGQMDIAGRGMTNGGRVCAIIAVTLFAIALALLLLALVLGVGLFALAGGAAAGAAGGAAGGP